MRMLGSAWAMVTFVDEYKVHYKSCLGPSAAEISTQIPLSESFCAYVVERARPLLIPDTRADSRFSGYRCVSEGAFRAYAGAPVIVDGLSLGTVCVIDDHPRQWTENHAEILASVAEAVATEVRLHRRSKQLRKSQDWTHRQHRTLQLAMHGAAINSFDWDIEHNHVAWSENLEDLLRLPPGTFAGTFEAFDALVHAEDRDRVKNAIERAFTGTDDAYQCQFRMWRGDGTLRWVRAHGIVERDASKRPIRLFGVDVDISENQHAEEALQARNRQLAILARISRLLILGEESGERSMNEVFAEIGGIIGMEMFYHYRLSEEPGVLRLAAADGIMEQERQRAAIVRFGTHLCGRVAESRTPLIMERLQDSPLPDAQALAAGGVSSYAGFPLIAHGKVLGTLAYASKASRHLEAGALQTIQSICDQVAGILEREALIEALRTSHDMLRARDAQLRMALEASRAVVFEWDIERNQVRRPLSAQEAFPETQDRSSTFEEVVEVVHPEDRAMFRANVQLALDSTDGLYASEFRVIDAQGNPAWIVETGRVERDSHARPIRLVGVSHDVTERKDVMAKLLASQSFTERVADVVPAVLYIYDLQERRNVWGNREMFGALGYSREQIDEMAGELLQRLIHAEDWPKYLCHAQALMQLEDAAVAEFEYRILRADGAWCWMYSRDMVFLRGKDGSPQQIVGAALDITARKDMEEHLGRLAKVLQDEHVRKDQFLAMLAHELRNPLAPLRNVSYFIERTESVDPSLERLRAVIDRQVRHMTRLVDDLLDISRLNQGKMRLDMTTVDLAVVVREAVDLAHPLIDARRHELSLTLPPDGVLCVQGDAMRLTQVVANLLNNAAKYTESGGYIAIYGELESGKVVLRVMDSGSGIAPELLPHVFDLFTQADRSLDRAQGGLGIGLALVRSLVALHGGDVDVTSTLNRGSTFTIRLPQSRTRCVVMKDTAQVRSAVSRRVLIVDDNADAADTLCTLLQMEGHAVRFALSAEAGLEIAADFQPEMCVLDIGLPGMSGLELVKRLRAMPQIQGAFCVALSGFGREEDKTRAQEAGFDVHLTKPVDPRRLLEVLNG